MSLRPTVAVTVALLCGAPAYLAFQESGKAAPEKIPAYYQTEAEAKPFPATLDPSQFKHPLVQRAYRAAREIPGVLAQQPCYCYCERSGHKGLLACHRDNHSAG